MFEFIFEMEFLVFSILAMTQKQNSKLYEQQLLKMELMMLLRAIITLKEVKVPKNWLKLLLKRAQPKNLRSAFCTI